LIKEPSGGKRRGSFSDIDFSKSESFYERPAYGPSSIQHLVQLAELQAVTPCESTYASFPDDYRSKQDNNVLVIQNECMTSHIIVCEKLGNFPLECDWSFSRHNQTPFSAPNPPPPRASPLARYFPYRSS
jgi:hypothetical protein